VSHAATVWAWDRIRTGNLASTRRLVLLTLADRHNSKTNQCHPSLNRLIEDTGLDRHVIPAAIRDLETEGLITVHRRPGAGSHYQFIGLHTSVENPTGGEKRTGGENPTAPVRDSTPQPVWKSAPEPGIEPGNNQEGDIPTTSSDSHSEERTKEKPEPNPAKPKRERKTRTVIPEDWKPSARCMELIEKAGIPRDFAERLTEEFIFYWREQGEKRPGWDSTFLGHAKRQWERNKKAPMTGRSAELSTKNITGANYARPQSTAQQNRERNHDILSALARGEDPGSAAFSQDGSGIFEQVDALEGEFRVIDGGDGGMG